jgi:hypothetical protein
VNPLRRRARREATPEFAPESKQIIETVSPFTMTSIPRLVGLLDAIRYVVENHIAGDVVECGVWRGGSMMAVALQLRALGDEHRQIWLFDTFEGMPPPGHLDRDHVDRPAARLMTGRSKSAQMTRAAAPLAEVRDNMASTSYPPDHLQFVPGPVEQSIPASAPERIAVLRLDTDWYESTRHELEHLVPRVSPGGVLIIDDYGHWKGARKAVDDYFSARSHKPLLIRLDYTGRIAVLP